MIFEKIKNDCVVLWLIKYQGDKPSGGLVVVLQVVAGSLQLNVTYYTTHLVIITMKSTNY
jgi:hypothetical protein